jgi:hypothetical protein
VKPVFSRALVVALAAQLASHAQAQEPTLLVPAPMLQSIASDFDAGLNPLYCFFGRADRTLLKVEVDSTRTVASPSACAGMGLGFVARIANAEFLMHALRGLIEVNPQFEVVSAFYKTEDVEIDGGRLHAARALSVIRGAPSVTLGRRSGG